MSAKNHDHEINKVIITKRDRQGDRWFDAIEEKTCDKMKQIFTCEEDVDQSEKWRPQKLSMTMNAMKEI
jgi:hypothetical protein